MKRLTNKILKSEGIRQSIVMIIGNNLATGIAAISLILISRILGPSMFGEFSVGIAIIMIWTRFIDLGMSTALMKRASEATKHLKINQLFSFTIRAKTFTSVVAIISGLIIVNLIMKSFEIGQPEIVYLGVILSIFTIAYDQLIVMLQSLQRFTQAVIVNFIQASIKLIAVVIFFLTSMTNPFWTFLAYASIPVIPLIFSKKLLPNWIAIDTGKPNKQTKNLMLSLVKHTSIGVISIALVENIGIIFVRGFMDAYETGLLGGVSRISTFLLIIAASLGNVLFARVAKYKTREHLLSYAKKAIVLSGLILASFVLFIPFSKLLISITIGPEYLSGNLVLLILAASSFIGIATVPFSALFYSFEKPSFFSITGIIQAFIIIVGNWVFIPKYGLVASATATFVSRLSMFILIAVWGLWILRKKYFVQSKTK